MYVGIHAKNILLPDSEELRFSPHLIESGYCCRRERNALWSWRKSLQTLAGLEQSFLPHHFTSDREFIIARGSRTKWSTFVLKLVIKRVKDGICYCVIMSYDK